MNPSRSKEERYRVILHSIGQNTEEEKERFCLQVSEHYGIPFDLMKRTVGRCPIIIKKDLPAKKAEMIAIAFQTFGATVSVERKRELLPIFLEFTSGRDSPLSLISSTFHKTAGGLWQILGRVENRSNDPVADLWVLIQLFDEWNELINFEEIPLPINPLPPLGSSPFKVLLEGEVPIKRVTITFKHASGVPLPALDLRDRREWIPIEWAGMQNRDFSPPPRAFPQEVLDLSESHHPMTPDRKGEGREREEAKKEEGRFTQEVELTSIEGAEDIQISQEEFTFPLMGETKSSEGEMPAGSLSEEGYRPEAIRSLMEDEIQEEELHLEDWQEGGQEAHRSTELPSSVSEPQVKQMKDETKREEWVQEEKPLPFSWIDSFRRTIETYQEKYPDPFSIWFDQIKSDAAFENRYHALLTLLIFARFHQTSPSESALSNTQKVFRFVLRKDFDPQEIPPLEGALFFPGEVWRDLFIRAVPKLQEVTEQILKKETWELSNLDRLIRIIPHMTSKNSRWAIRFIHDRFPDIALDLSTMDIEVNEAIYRVASRLGVVHPLFDYYQGKHSIGDQKLQSFSREVYPDDPVKIEEPLSRLGGDGEGGCCFPKDPQCPNCPFEPFCPKRFLEINPSEKGMMVSSH